MFRSKIALSVSLVIVFAGLTFTANAADFTGTAFDSSNFDYFHLEGFDAMFLQTPGVAMNGGISGQDASWYSYGSVNPARFIFEQEELDDMLPTHAGIYLTAIDSGINKIIFTAYGTSGITLVKGIDSPVAGIFLGAIDFDGITKITVKAEGGTEFKLDDLQYGHVPEPATMLLMSLGSLICLKRKKNR